MKNSYYKKLFDNWMSSIKRLRYVYDPRKKGQWLSRRKFKKREEILQEWISKMYKLNKKHNPENK